MAQTWILTTALLLYILTFIYPVVGENGGYWTDYDLRRAIYELESEDQEERAVGDLVPDKVKDKFKCKLEGEGCRGLPHCCGKLNCYWSKGFSLLKDGECVVCVKEGEKCQRDKQCCGEAICDKGSPVDLNGECGPKRLEGKCYRDKQCVNDCDKKWYNMRGRCL